MESIDVCTQLVIANKNVNCRQAYRMHLNGSGDVKSYDSKKKLRKKRTATQPRIVQAI